VVKRTNLFNFNVKMISERDDENREHLKDLIKEETLLGVDFTKLLRVPFSYKNTLCSFSLITVWLCNFFSQRILAQKLCLKC